MKKVAYAYGLAVILGAFALAGCGGAEDRKAGHLQKGGELFAEGDYEKARLEYKNALQIDPKDSEARFRLGETLEKLQQWRAAAGHYKAAVEQDPEHVAARVALAKLYLLGNAPDEAMALVDEVLALEPGNPDALVVRAGIKVREEALEEALVDARAALEADADHAQALSLLAAIHLRQGRESESIQLLERAVAAHPDNTALRASLATVYARAGRTDRAGEMLEEIAAAEPENVAHRVRLARFYTGVDDLDAAEATLRRAVEEMPEETAARLALLEFLAQQRSADAAIAAVEAFVAEFPEDHELRFAQARLYEAVGRTDDERAVYEGIVAGDLEGLQGLKARNRLARLAAKAGDREEARRQVEAVLEQNPKDTEALALRGDLAMLAQDYVGAVADYRTVLEARPEDPKVVLALSRAHLANDDKALAEEVLREALRNAPNNVDLRFRLAEVLAAEGRMEASAAQLDKVLDHEPGNAKALEGLVKLHLSRKDWDAARDSIERYKQAYPERPQGYYFEGLLLQAQGDLSQGTAAFEKSLEQAGDDAVQPLSAVVRSHVAAGEHDKALERIEGVLKANPKNYVGHNLRGEVLLLKKEYGEAEKAFSKALEYAPKLVAAHRNLALARFAQGEQEGAVEAFRQGIEATASPALRFALAAVLEGLGRPEEAILEHQAVLDAAPGSQAAANNLAMLLATYRDDPQSLDRALELARPLGQGDNAAYLDTLGWVHYKRGEYEQALPLLERAVQTNPEAPEMHFHLGMAQYRLGASEAAARHLERALAGGGQFREADVARGTLEEIRGG